VSSMSKKIPISPRAVESGMSAIGLIDFIGRVLKGRSIRRSPADAPP
jgi:hypothetical protein